MDYFQFKDTCAKARAKHAERKMSRARPTVCRQSLTRAGRGCPRARNAGQTRPQEKFGKKQTFGKKSGKNSDDFAEAPSEVPG